MAKHTLGQTWQPCRDDSRYRVTLTATGKPKPEYVLFFADERISGHATLGAALMRAVGHKERRCYRGERAVTGDVKIFTAFARGSWGYTAFSYETWPSGRHGAIKCSLHLASEETKEAAYARVMRDIRHDWQGKALPPVIDCGRVSFDRGKAMNYGKDKA
jgi:hypothetical protein